jgi:6-phosphogluconolactonase
MTGSMTEAVTDAVLADPAALAAYAAAWMADTLNALPGRVAVALSGGSTPKAMYEQLATPAYASRLPWDRVHWFWGDERFVPQDDERSNYRMTMEAMLRHVAAPSGNIHPVPTEDVSAEEAARQYQIELQAFYGAPILQPGRPLFGIVLLGLGTNGHTASLFPDTPVLEERTAWAAEVTPEGEPTRITLTYPALESCHHAAFLVAGADKRDVMARVRAGDAALPAARVHPSGVLHWFTDRAAAG